MITFLIIMVFGAFGAASRFALNEWISSLKESRFPIGTFVINISGSFVAGVLASLIQLIPEVQPYIIPIIVGYLGSFTTFSTWMVQTMGLIDSKEWWYLIFNTIGAVFFGVLAALAGFWLGFGLFE